MTDFINRELSWLEFNRRVLEISHRPQLPLGEKTRFLSIYQRNLDEFFMVRVGALWDREKAKSEKEGARVQLQAISQRTHELAGEVSKDYRELISGLEEAGFGIQPFQKLNKKDKAWAYEYFRQWVFPLLTARVLGEGAEFPLVKNKTLNFLVPLVGGPENEAYGHIQVPGHTERLVELPKAGGRRFILLEELLRDALPELFPNCRPGSPLLYRITRNADLEYNEEEAEDLLESIQKSIRKRNWGQVVRLEIQGKGKPQLIQFLWKAFRITSRDTYHSSIPLDLGFLDELLRKKCFQPFLTPEFQGRGIFPEGSAISFFRSIRERDILCHVPYDDFSGVTELIRLASRDEKVAAIKQTLYRVSKRSPILEALGDAARAGKNVTVLLELKARFDEENNIAWARKLEQAGVQVILTPLKIKTHAKLLLIVRKEKDAPGGYRKYCHLSTGNYNEKTAKVYEDLSLFTCHPEIGEDMIQLFHYLTGAASLKGMKRLIVSPLMTRGFFRAQAEEEIAMVRKGKKGRICCKVNAIIDKEMMGLLIRAAEEGVEVQLLVRGICSLPPIPGIRIRSIVGRFLEHSRIYIFGVGERRRAYLGSMDLMERNFDRRVEVLFPILDPENAQRIYRLFGLLMKDTVNSYILLPEGRYRKVTGKMGFNVHEHLLKEGI